MFRKIAVFALLFAVVLASFPTNSVLAKDITAEKMEKKWDQLVTSYKNQSFAHEKAHNLVENWLKTHKDAKAADKAELQKHLTICNSPLESAKAIVTNHAGFDKNGMVIDRAIAAKSIKTLANYLQQHAGSVRNLKDHTK